jgi:predicted amidophosphoribosyltransferase
VSIWTLLIMTGPLPAFRVLRRWRGRRNLEPGACPACGYDLRATPERCPECGTMATVTNEHANKQLTGGLPKAEGNDA